MGDTMSSEATATGQGEGAAAARVERYLAEYARMPHLDQGDIHSLNLGSDREAILRTADLRELLALVAEARSEGRETR